MKISFNWIKQYLKTDIKPEDLVERIKLHLSDTEGFEDLTEKYKGIVIGEIVEKAEHPNADKLGVYQVKIDEGQIVQVVAGDKKLKVGDKVIYLPIGSKIPNNPYPEKFDGIITKAKLRGVDSYGMLASEKELGISSNHENVMTLELECTVGQETASVLNLNDFIIEVENKTLTIRPDAFGIIGITRDIAGFLNLPFETPAWLKDPLTIKPKALDSEQLPLSVLNKAQRLCPRYMAVSMKNVEVKDSPLWLKTLLSSVGFKPINNVVDITNYLMLLTGQPLHAFDYDKVISKDLHYKNKAVITIRTAQQGEKLTTIDQKTRELNEKTVVICDSQNPIAIGGVMGGIETEIDKNTKNIIIESANFDLYNIRKTSMALGLLTDAVTRFSKGQDPNLCEPTLYKAIELMQEMCNAELASNIQDNYAELPKPHKLSFSVEYFQKHTGLSLSREEILKILANIEINEIPSKDAEYITLEIPTYRQDLKIAEDVHEEIARLYGYSNIPLTLPTREITSTPTNKQTDFEKRLRYICKNLGTNEVLTYNFVGQTLCQNCNLNIENNYKITNSLSPELEYMRTTLLPSLLEKISLNINNGYQEFAIYEINKIHNKKDFSKEEQLPLENKMFSMLFTTDTEHIYYNIKHYLDLIITELKGKEIYYELVQTVKKDTLPNHIQTILPMLDINKSAIVSTNINKEKVFLGVVGELNPVVQKRLKITQSIGVMEINANILRKISNYNKGRIDFSKYPKITQDLCFVLNKEIPYQILVNNIAELLKKRKLNFVISPVDIYQADDKNKKQVTVRLTLQHKEKTLKEKDIQSIRQIIEKSVKKDLNGVIKTQ